MKNKQFWFNLPVNDIDRARSFYTSIGFDLNPGFTQSDQAASLLVGDRDIILMLFPSEVFKTFVKNDSSNTDVTNEVLFNLSAQNQEEVDAMVQKVNEAGGSIYEDPVLINGWMYGLGFADPDFIGTFFDHPLFEKFKQPHFSLATVNHVLPWFCVAVRGSPMRCLQNSFDKDIIYCITGIAIRFDRSSLAYSFKYFIFHNKYSTKID